MDVYAHKQARSYPDTHLTKRHCYRTLILAYECCEPCSPVQENQEVGTLVIGSRDLE